MRAAIVIAALLPAALALGTWSKVGDIDGVITAMQFVNGTNGYAASSDQQSSLAMLSTEDGGVTWTPHAVAKLGLLPLGIAAAPPAVLVAGLFTDFISHDNGNTFAATKGDHAQSQCQRAANGMFFSVGQQDGGSGQGVCVSVDGGTTFKGYWAPVAKTSARYGAFPSKTTWYLSMGAWPETDDDKPADDEGLVAMQRRLGRGPAPPAGAGWAAQIVKTSDAGATWVSAFEDMGNFYFNEIACEDEKNCCASGEADETSPAPGDRIYCTNDGTTWTQRYFLATGAGLMTMDSLGNGVFVAGGTFSEDSSAAPGFVFSTDMGKTWSADIVTGVGEVAIIASSFPNDKVGFGIGVDQFNSMELLKWTN